MKPNNFARCLLLCIAVVLLAPCLKAQISVGLQLDRTTYIPHEAISGNLTVVNRAGRDLILGSNSGANWLDYSITDGQGRLISPVGKSGLKPIVIASGQTYTIKVTINENYPMARVGRYRIKANVTFPQINQVFASSSTNIQIAIAKSLWSQVVGVPQGYPGAGTYRVYETLAYYHGARSKALYFRLSDNETGEVYSCFTLGDYLNVRPPSFRTDRENHLHVIQMAAPLLYNYTVLDLDGEVLTRQNHYEKDGSRPALFTTQSGDVVLRGGVTEKDYLTPYENREFRLLSERPPGLPGG